MIDPSAPRPTEPVQPSVGRAYVLCEGLDEVYLVNHLAKELDVDLIAGTRTRGVSWNEEVNGLVTACVRQEARSVGFIFDAERSADEAQARILKALSQAGVRLDGGPAVVEDVEIFGGTLRIGYLILPHGESVGALDSLFLPQVQDDPLSNCIQPFMNCLDECGALQTKNAPKVLLDKVFLRTYLAVKGPSNTGIGAALNDGRLSCQGDSFEVIAAFLQSL